MTNYSHQSTLFGSLAKANEPLAPYTTYKIGGPADIFLEVKTKDAMVQALQIAKKNDIPWFVLGGGTNILIADKGVRGLVIKNSIDEIVIRGMKGVMKNGASEKIVFVEVGSGVAMNKLVRYTIEEGLQGLEMHLGLPGSVGGAVYMNSKWMKPKGFVGDVVYQAEILHPNGQTEAVGQSYFRFGYGESFIQKSKDIVLSVTFALKKADKDTLWSVANESIIHRKTTQPAGKTAGCMFKNISEMEALTRSTPNQSTSAGFLIDKAGGKSLSVGDAGISPLHANFFMNNGKATASDMVQLVASVKEKVKHAYGVELKEEVQMIGEF